MTDLHIDFETRSTVDLRKTGAYVYAEHPKTDLWVVCYALGDGPVQRWLPGEPCPAEIAEHVLLGGTCVAHNANFERVIWKLILTPCYGWPEPEIEQWRCTMVMAYAMALPGALKDAAVAVGMPEQKDMSGHRLMLQMSRPRKVAGKEITWWNTPDKLERLYAYCAQDVETERALEKRLRPLKESELDLWHLDQKINDRGVAVDVALAESATRIVAAEAEKHNEEIRAATAFAVTACSNRNQIVAYIREQGVAATSIAKDQLEEMLADSDLPPQVRRVLEIRRSSAKASVAKIDALTRGMNADGRARGLCQFHAASTGRWAGRRFQPQNLKRPDLKDVDTAIEFILSGDVELVRAAYDEPLSVVGDTIRGLIKAPPGKKLISADYSNIEGRALAWLAGEDWKMDAFRAFDNGFGHDLYKLTAGKILGKDPGAITDDERQAYGKVPELALGFQGGVGAFQTMAVNYGVDLTDDEVIQIRDNWRTEHPATRQFWWDLEAAAIEAVENPKVATRVGPHILFKMSGSFLMMRLPSKRFLAYAYPEIRWKKMPWGDENWLKAGSEEDARAIHGDLFKEWDEEKGMALVLDPQEKLCLSYMGVNSYTRKWQRCWAYGGLIAENATQATARDVLGHAMPELEAAGYPIILTVHDEIVCEVVRDFGSVDEVCRVMSKLPPWAAGMPVAAAGWEGERYRK